MHSLAAASPSVLASSSASDEPSFPLFIRHPCSGFSRKCFFRRETNAQIQFDVDQMKGETRHYCSCWVRNGSRKSMKQCALGLPTSKRRTANGDRMGERMKKKYLIIIKVWGKIFTILQTVEDERWTEKVHWTKQNKRTTVKREWRRKEVK